MTSHTILASREEYQLGPDTLLVGRTVSYAVVGDFRRHFGGQLVEGSGISGLHKDDQGNWLTDLKMSMYTLDLSKLPEQLLEARLIEVSRPLVKVNKAETQQQKNRRKTQKLAKPFLNHEEATDLNEDALRASHGPLRCHPIVGKAYPQSRRQD